MRSKMILVIAAVTLASFPADNLAVPLVHAQAGADPMSTGVIIRGVTMFRKVKQQDIDTLAFYVNVPNADGGTSASIQLLPEHVREKASVSSTLYSQLASGGFVTIRLASVAPLEIGAALDSALVKGLVECFPQLDERNVTDAIYQLACFDAKRRATNQVSDLELVTIGVITPNQSMVDQFLVRRLLGDEQVTLVRVEK